MLESVIIGYVESIRLGLRENLRQFILLVIINGFVGGMVGLERSILPAIAEEEFGIAARTSILSFILVFGVTKAWANYFTGKWSNQYGRKRLLILGWIFGIPVPLLLMYAPDWSWIVVANVFLGLNQGLAWSSTVVMKIDLVGERQRGLAMGINESAGYLSIAIISFATAAIAARYGLRPYPFYLGIGFVVLGLIGSIFLVRDTRQHVSAEIPESRLPRLTKIFRQTSWTHYNLGSVTQAGLINNLNDGMVWGLFPILLSAHGFTLEQIGMVTAVYPAVWGLGQLVTGRISDIICKKDLLYTGMMLQAIALVSIVWAESLFHFIGLSVLLGWGTAMVYPTFLASIAENTHPLDRAESIGIFRLWRDLGYAFGALLTGILADLLSVHAAVFLIAVLTMLSSLTIQYRMKCASGRPLKVWQWLLGWKPAAK